MRLEREEDCALACDCTKARCHNCFIKTISLDRCVQLGSRGELLPGRVLRDGEARRQCQVQDQAPRAPRSRRNEGKTVKPGSHRELDRQWLKIAKSNLRGRSFGDQLIARLATRAPQSF